MDCLLGNNTTVELLLSLSSLSLSSSTFSFPDNMLDDLSNMQDADNDPMLGQLIQATQQLNRQINDSIQDDAINWGNVPTIQDLSDSDCVSNYHMRKSSLQILADRCGQNFLQFWAMTSTGSNARINTQFTMNQASSSCCTGTPYLIVFIQTWKRSLEYENPIYLPLYNPFLKPFTKILSHI